MSRIRREQAALLAGALLAVGVVIALLARGGDGPTAPATTQAAPPPPHPPPPPAPSDPRHDADVRGGMLVVDGKPFFPIFSWGECTDGFETSLPVGTNVYAANRCGGLEAQLPALRDRALSAAVQGEAVPDTGAVVGVFYPDEPDGQGLTAKTMQTIPPALGVRFLTLTNHFYSGAAPLAQGRGIYPGLIAKADMVGFDLYPLQNWCRPERLVDVYHSQRELVDLAKGRPTFQWIEAAGMTCPHDGPTAVTPQTVRAESWLAIAGGAKGLGFFPPAAWTGDVGEAILDVTSTVKQLERLLVAPETAVHVEPSSGLVRAGARKLGGRLAVIAVNAAYDSAEATVTVPGLDGRALSVVGTRRRVDPSGDSFTERFPPLGTRVYTTT